MLIVNEGRVGAASGGLHGRDLNSFAPCNLLPYSSAALRGCKLICTPEGSNQPVVKKSRASDGTRCHPIRNDRCIFGICRVSAMACLHCVCTKIVQLCTFTEFFFCFLAHPMFILHKTCVDNHRSIYAVPF